MNEDFNPETFEFLIHLLELSVVVGIGVIVYITKKHSKGINEKIEQRLKDELDLSSRE